MLSSFKLKDRWREYKGKISMIDVKNIEGEKKQKDCREWEKLNITIAFEALFLELPMFL